MPPIKLVVDEYGQRLVPLASLRAVLEYQLNVDPEGASIEALLEVVTHAEDAPLPGSPQRADIMGGELPGVDLAVPVQDEHGNLVHPGAV